MSFESNARKIAEVAAKLDVDPSLLDALINFETAGSYDPLKAGPATTGARGLIQIIDSTARSDFGYSDSLALISDYPTFDEQMDNVVYPYLKKYSPFKTQQSLYMAVFYPAYRFVPPDKQFPPEVQRVNPGIRTPQDYINFVNRRIRRDTLHFPPATAPLLVIAAAGLWFLYKRFSR
jgi:hypothetical protein